MRISDQTAAIKLAICDDIGERSYDVADVAAILVQMLTRIPSVGKHCVYRLTVSALSGLLRVLVDKVRFLVAHVNQLQSAKHCR